MLHNQDIHNVWTFWNVDSRNCCNYLILRTSVFGRIPRNLLTTYG